MDTSEKIVQLLKLSENVLESVNKIVSESEKDRIEARESRKDMDKFNRIMIQEIRDSTKSINKVISGYINNESNLIEKEINGYIRNYLENDSKFNNFTIFDISSSWRLLKENKIEKDPFVNKQTITDFDGIFILSSDDNYAPLAISDKTVVRSKNKNNNNSQSKIKKFLIVEAKHCLDNTQLNKKISQIERFQEYLKESHTIDKEKFTIEYKNKVISYKLNEFETDIILIFGSEDMGENQIELLKEKGESLREKKIEIGYLKPSGKRYELYCYKSEKEFEQNKNIYHKEVGATKLTLRTGGKKRRQQS